MDQIFIFIIVAAIWAAKAWWNKQQEALAAEELERREREEPRRVTPPPTHPAYEADQRYKDIQEEIRRRIAQRAGVTLPAPEQTATPRAEMPPYVPNPQALPPIRPQPAPTLLRPKPTPPRAQPKPSAQPAPVAASSAETRAYAGATMMSEAQAYPDEVTAFALPSQTMAPASALHALLASPNAVRRAFVLREILDRPLCMRDTPGGQEFWT